MPEPAPRTTRGSGGKLSHLRLKNTTKGFSPKHQAIIDSSRGQDPEPSGNSVEPTVTTERNLTAYGINGIKYIRRVLVGHRKVRLNMASNGKALTRNMTLAVGHVSRNDILVGFSDDLQPLEGKILKIQDGRFEKNPEKETQEEKEAVRQQEERVLETATFSEYSKRMSMQKVETGTTPSSSLPLATIQVQQPPLVPFKTQDQPTTKTQSPSRDRHYNKTSLLWPLSSTYRYSGSPALSGSSTSLINISSVRSSRPIAVQKENLMRKTTASQGSQHDEQGLLIESVRGTKRDSSVTNLADGTTNTESTNIDKFPKHKQTINKTIPLYHRMSHPGTFPRRPNIGPLQNRTSTSQHPYRSPLRRPILLRVNNTARTKVEPGIITSRQSVLNPNHTPSTWQGKNRTVVRLPPKLLSQKPNLKNDNGLKVGVSRDKNTSKESNTIFTTDNGADPKFNDSLSPDKTLSKSNDTIQPIRRGSGNTTDHDLPSATNRDRITTWQTVPHHQRASGVIRQNASNLKKRPTYILQRKNNTVIRLPIKFHTRVNVNSTTIHGPKKASKYETRHKDSKDASKESQLGLPTDSDTNLFANMSTEGAPWGTNETLQPDNGGAENSIDHTNKEQNLNRVTNRDYDLPSVTPGEPETPKIATRDQDLQRVTNRDSNSTMQMLINHKAESKIRKDGTLDRFQPILHTQIKPNPTSIPSGLKDFKDVQGAKESTVTLSTDEHTAEGNFKPQAVDQGVEVADDNILPSITNRDQDLSRITNRDHHLPRVPNRDQHVPSDTNRGNSTTVKQVTNQKVVSELSSRENIPNQNLRQKFILRKNGRFPPKLQTQIKQNSTATQMQKEAEFNHHGQTGQTPNFTATFTMRKNNQTVFRNTLESEIKPKLHGDRKQMKEISTARHTVPHNTLNRNPRPHFTQQRKNPTINRLPPKAFSQVKPNYNTRGNKSSVDAPKIGRPTEIPLSTDKATSQRNTSFPVAEVSKDAISQVEAQNVTSKGFIIIWVAPKGRFKNFVIRITEKKDEGVNQGDGSNPEEREERKEGNENEITINAIDFVRRNSSEDGVRKNFSKILPGSARSYPVSGLIAQTDYSVTLYGTGPGLRSNVHTFIIRTGTQNLKVHTLTK